MIKIVLTHLGLQPLSCPSGEFRFFNNGEGTGRILRNSQLNEINKNLKVFKAVKVAQRIEQRASVICIFWFGNGLEQRKNRNGLHARIAPKDKPRWTKPLN